MQSLLAAVQVPAVSHAQFGQSPEVLNKINDAETNLCVWQRPSVRQVSAEVANVVEPDLDLRARTTARMFKRDVQELLNTAGLNADEYAHWVDDLAQLADVFFTHAHRKEAMVRIETTIDDGCRRYHVDRSHLRLLSTYRGPGTEWLTNEQVDRHNLRSGAPNEDIVRYGQPYRMAPFWVGLFKGSLYPNMADNGLVHRSPPIDGTGQFRVRFCLDC